MFAYSWSDSGCETDPSEPASWQEAACQDGSGTLTALFFSDEEAEINLAKAICCSCPMVATCLEGALERREPAGVWGGQLFADGRVIPRKRKRGRPPKVAVTIPSEPERNLSVLGSTNTLGSRQIA